VIWMLKVFGKRTRRGEAVLAAPSATANEPTAAGREHRIRATAELVTMAAIATLGVAVVVDSIRMGLHNALGVGPGMFPFVSGVALACLGLGGTVTGVVRRCVSPHRDASSPTAGAEPVNDAQVMEEERAVSGEEPQTFTSVNWRTLAIAVALLLGFVAVMSYFGFVISLTALMLALMLLVARRGPVFSIVMTVATALAVYYGFGVLLDVHLPGPTASFLTWMNP
jgi:hypothetical protein